MGKHAEKKTNAMRELDRIDVEYRVHRIDGCEGLTGLEMARKAGEDPDRVFKTLVTVGKSGDHFVFMIPVGAELDLKKAADAVGEKSVHMVKSKELLGLTGYIHGGCSPLGMKKRFVTACDETALLYDSILFSGGKIGCQIETGIASLQKALPVSLRDLTL